MKRWQFWLGLAISAVFLFFALRGVDFRAAWQAALMARWEYLAGAWLCLLASYVVRAWRWKNVLACLKPLSLWTVWRVLMVGFVSNNILPARIGEVVRAYVLGRTAQIDTAAALGTIAIERVFDVLMALLLLVVGVAFGVLGGAGYSLWLGAAMVGGLVVGVLAAAVWGEALAGWGERLIGRFSPAWGKKLADLARSFVGGLRSAGSPLRVGQLAVGSAIAWGLFMAYAWLVLHAFGLPIQPAGLAFVLGVAGLGVAIPSAPGSVGTLEYAYIFGLELLQIGDSSTRASFALTYHVMEWVTTLALGLFCLGQLGLSLRQVSSMAAADIKDKS